ncbi:helix-turn-helix transcriptional regulator [Planococcus wigleyi]|uniref:DNA-binding response regulator n=1 Tax=Planococcus wigleyi TaxID=2762216 RepID=A0ABR8WA26_9BACL|nr:DNA-binding response regulator [Planococcus wigleyi]MBD8013876.1 DNA-binding response regulator [Planococcus wigleyi]
MNKWQIEDLLKDYQWKLQSVKIMRESMNEINVNMTAQYGLQAAMPKASGNPSDPILREVERRDERWKKIHDYEKDIQLIQSKIQKVNNEREVEVLYWLLDGKSMRWIGLHMGLSHTHIQRIKDAVIENMIA